MTYNLLELLDNLEPFDTIKEGDMVIRLAPDESPVMKELRAACWRASRSTRSASAGSSRRRDRS